MNWACTVKKRYYDAIKDGRKVFEVRKRVPSLMDKNDILFICCKDEVIKCRVVSVKNMDKREAWYLFACGMCIEEWLYDDYLRGYENVNIIGLRIIREVANKELVRFRSAVSRNPQWFCKVK